MWIVADVTFDTDTEAREAERLAREGKVAGVSVDLGDVSSEVQVIEVDDDGYPSDWLETVIEGEILGATQVAMPAFADARIVEENGQLVAYLAPEGVQTSDRRIIGMNALTWRDNAPLMFNDSSDGHVGALHVGNLTNFRRVGVLALTAAADPPTFMGVTRPTVKNGQIAGHGASWGVCHLNTLAETGQCLTPPSCDYAAGTYTIYKHPRGDIHAPVSPGMYSMEAAERWYSAHCEAVATIRVGEDDYGIWVAGQTTLPDGEYYLSGDWRQNGKGGLDLHSFLVVEHPAYPLAITAAGEPAALVAAGIVTETTEPSIDERLRRLEDVLFTPSEDLVAAFETPEDERIESLYQTFVDA